MCSPVQDLSVLHRRFNSTMPPSKINYVLGFAFSADSTGLVLIKKPKPAWQAGKLNGVGGKVEAGETSLDAMLREFKEETTVETTAADWRQFASMGSVDWNVDVFCAFNDKFDECQTNTPEKVILVSTEIVGNLHTISNLHWLIPMALNSRDDVSFAQAKVQYL